jgi:hypothetical protein
MLAPGSTPDVIVDLSNVCRDDDVPPVGGEVSLRRLDTVLQLWAEQHGGPPRGIAIADRSLIHHLSDAGDRRRLRDMVADGYATQEDSADAEILRLAEL